MVGSGALREGMAQVLAADPETGRRLLGYAKNKCRGRGDAREVAHEATLRVLAGKGWHRWDPYRRTLLNHLADVVDSLVANATRRASLRRERPMSDGEEDGAPDSTPSPEERLAAEQDLERRRRLKARVMARVEGDPIIPRMLAHEQSGISDAAALAAVLGCAPKDIKRARERLAYHRNLVVAEAEQEEAERMNAKAS